jgi:hypothetical protein
MCAAEPFEGYTTYGKPGDMLGIKRENAFLNPLAMTRRVKFPLKRS